MWWGLRVLSTYFLNVIRGIRFSSIRAHCVREVWLTDSPLCLYCPRNDAVDKLNAEKILRDVVAVTAGIQRRIEEITRLFICLATIRRVILRIDFLILEHPPSLPLLCLKYLYVLLITSHSVKFVRVLSFCFRWTFNSGHISGSQCMTVDRCHCNEIETMWRDAVIFQRLSYFSMWLSPTDM